MENHKETRWKQRFQNFERAFNFLFNSLTKKEFTELEKAGIIQSYEFTFELAWKTLKDFLDSKGITAQFPRDVIKESFQNNLISNGEIWLDMLNKRNLMSHTYDEATADFAFSLISQSYIAHIAEVYNFLKDCADE